MTPLSCTRCRRAVSFTPKRDEELRRCRQFLAFAAVLALIAGGLYLAEVPLWPWWIGGMAVYVLSQAAFKWHLSRWAFCHPCQHGRYVYRRAAQPRDG